MSYPIKSQQYLDSYNYSTTSQNSANLNGTQDSGNDSSPYQNYDMGLSDPNANNYEDNLGIQDSFEGSDTAEVGDGSLSVSDEQARLKDILNLLKKNKDLSSDARKTLTDKIYKLQKTLTEGNTIQSATTKANWLTAIDSSIAAVEAEVFGQSSEGDAGNELDFGDGFGSNPPQNSPDSLRSDIDQLKKSIETNVDLPQDEKDSKLEQIGKWLSALDLQPSDDSLQSIREGVDSMKMGDDGSDTSDAADEMSMETPVTRVEKGIRYFESKNSEDITVCPAEKGTTNVVSTNGTVTISPANNKVSVEVSQNGQYTVVRVKGEKEDVYKIKSNVSKIQIDSDNVTGDFENEDGKVTVGSKGDTFVSPKKFKEYADTLRKASALIGSTFQSEGSPGANEGEADYQMPADNSSQATSDNSGQGDTAVQWKYSGDSPQKNKDVQNALEKMAKAIEATDPKDKQALWDEALNEINNWLNVNSDEMGDANDRFGLLSRVLRGELGEAEFKKVLQSGIIPRDFAMRVSDGLLCKQDEDFSRDEAHRGIGGDDDWNHKTYADFWDKNSAPSTTDSNA